MRMRGDMLTVWLCLLWVSHGVCSMYLCKDFHVYCEQFCAFEYVLCLGSVVCFCVVLLCEDICVVCLLGCVCCV